MPKKCGGIVSVRTANYHIRRLCALSWALIACACQKHAELPTVGELSLEKYMGTWKEVASLPQWFQQGCYNTEAVYTLRQDGKITVLNRCQRKEGNEIKLSSVEGTAWMPDPQHPGRLRVRFFWPLSSPYFVLQIDPEYQWVLVGTPNRKGLWVLSRTGHIEEHLYQELLTWGRVQGFPIERMQKTQYLEPNMHFHR